MMNADEAISDLKKYVESKDMRLSMGAENIFREAESMGQKYNRDIYYYLFLPALIRTSSEIQSLLLRRNCDPDNAISACINEIIRRDDDKFDDNLPPYSADTDNRIGCRETLIDFAISVALRKERREILKQDVLEALLEAHDDYAPPEENFNWTDKSLNVPFNTLSHIIGHYEKNLWITFDDIKSELNLYRPAEYRRKPLDATPQRLKSAVIDLFSDWPDYRKNCFLIMPFRETPFHAQVQATLKRILAEHGFNLLRADDRAYTNDVFSNVEAYIYGTRFAFAIHDRIESNMHNPNVALEVGYFMGQKKEVCLLKEKSVAALPSDLQGQLYISFDMFNIDESLKKSVDKWLYDKRLIDSQK